MRTNISDGMSDAAVLGELGQRLARRRLDRNVTQEEVAVEAGVSRRSVSKIENGHVVDTRVLVRVLRALDLLGALETLAPKPEASPVALLEARGKQRERASGRRAAPSPAAEGWTWPDDNR